MSIAPVGKCINFRACAKADNREPIQVAARDANPICPNCREPLLVSTPIVNPRRNAFIAIGIAGALLFVGLGFAVKHSLASGSMARVAVPAAVAATVPASAVAATVPRSTVALAGTHVETSGSASASRAGAGGTAAAAPPQIPSVTIPPDGASAYASLGHSAQKVDVVLYFKRGSGILDSQAESDVSRLAPALKADTQHGRKVVVAGFADDTGDAEYSKVLSLKRAQRVAAELALQGVVVDRAVGFGQTAPVGDNATAAGREENRRVEIFVAP